jgi:hypothetical protein
MVQAMLCGKEGLFFLSPAPVGRLSTQPPARRAYAPEGDLRENYFFWSDSLIPLQSGTGIPNQTNHQPLTGPMV